MKRYEVTGHPLDASPVTNCAMGDVIELELDATTEAALIGAGAIRALPEAEAEVVGGADEQAA